MTPAAVFDTNVLFSATGWRGRPYRCVELAREGIIHGIVCQEILDELADKLQTKLNFSDEMATDVIADLLGFLQLVIIPNTLKFIQADPDDDAILECAIVSRANYIVTGDRRHLLPIGEFEGVQIISPADFLTLISAQS
ncbi:MAG: putative toxin-antitoxin system toxin component, PIN family [Aquificales bacterium]|nr:putative toxin-antitoxin system toxin component, PIN family [Aquificales bacterium]